MHKMLWLAKIKFAANPAHRDQSLLGCGLAREKFFPA